MYIFNGINNYFEVLISLEKILILPLYYDYLNSMKFSFILFPLIFTSCASVFSARRQNVVISSNNEEAVVYIDSVLAGKGDFVSISLPKNGKSKQLRIVSDHYEDRYSVVMQSKKSWLFNLNYPFLLPLFFDKANCSHLYQDTFLVENEIKQYEFLKDSIFSPVKVTLDQKLDAKYFKEIEFNSYLTKGVNKSYAVSNWEYNDLDEYVRVKADLENMFGVSNEMDKAFRSLANKKMQARTVGIDTLLEFRLSIPKIELYRAQYEDIVSGGMDASAYFYNAQIICELFKKGSLVYRREITVMTDEFVRNEKKIAENLFNKVLFALYNDEAFGLQLYKSPVDFYEGVISIRQTEKVSSLNDAFKSTVTVVSETGHGSGFFIGHTGEIITNAHVVAENGEYKILLNDGTVLNAKVKRRDFENDLALLQCDYFAPKVFGISDHFEPQIGQDIYVIGTPISTEMIQTLTKGVFSGNQEYQGKHYYQTDASINGGNSGGPVVSKDGEFIGIVVAKLIGEHMGGVGFCIPSEFISSSLNIIIE